MSSKINANIPVKLYNTLGNKTEEVKGVNDKIITMYNCGPTVHRHHTHIGNLRSYTISDLLKRFFGFLGYEVIHAIKITDVDDHIIKYCKDNKKQIGEYIEPNILDFLDQIKKLNLKIPEHLPRVTQNIDALVKAIQELDKKGYVYFSNSSAYFDISKIENYGVLVNLEKQNKFKRNAQGRLRSFVIEDKRNENDFCLWKAWTEDDGDIYWETEIGKGRPGWHLECSVLSRMALGDTINIHLGGISHIFPHHTNEIAISEALTGKTFVNYWVHHDYLIVEGKAMLKADKTLYTLQDILDKNYHPLALRYTLMKTHFQQALDFSWQSMNESCKTIDRILIFYHFLNQESIFTDEAVGVDVATPINECKQKFSKALADNLNFSEAIAAVFQFVNRINKIKEDLNRKNLIECKNFIDSLDEVLGFIRPLYGEYKSKVDIIADTNGIEEMLSRRQAAKISNDYKKADELRNAVENLGLNIIDLKGLGSYCLVNNFLDSNQ